MTKEIVLYKIPQVFEKAAILESSVLKEYNASLEPFNEHAKRSLGQYKVVDGELAGSSPLMQIHLLNSGVLPEGDRLVTRADLEKAVVFDRGNKFLGGIYTDFGLALKTEGDPYEIDGVKVNDAIARKLAMQLKKREIALGGGVLIPFSAFKETNKESERYGVTLDLNDLATKETIRPLQEFTWSNLRGEGLSCASLDFGRGWDSDDGHLGRSYGNGRVVVVRAGGTPKKFLVKLKNEIDAKLHSLQ
ncbi:hypothetical protein J4462_01955 [Candidatus Pacearchaeota archaeon]|nr:hypothetical protein [Candidatus Pacearchaeota archaeon]